MDSILCKKDRQCVCPLSIAFFFGHCFKKDTGHGEENFTEWPHTWSLVSMQGITKQSTTSYL